MVWHSGWRVLHNQPQHVLKIPSIVGGKAFEIPLRFEHTQGATKNCWDQGMFLSKDHFLQNFTCTIRTSELLLQSTA
jgi:hypothetical protein